MFITCEFCGEEIELMEQRATPRAKTFWRTPVDQRHVDGSCNVVKRFVSLEELAGGVGFALDTLPKTTLMSWGFDIEGEITVWDEFDGRWFWQRKPNVVKN